MAGVEDEGGVRGDQADCSWTFAAVVLMNNESLNLAIRDLEC